MGLSSVPHGKLVAYKSYIYVIKIFNYHVGLNAECNRPVSSVPHGKLVAYKSYIYVIKIFNYHVGTEC